MKKLMYLFVAGTMFAFTACNFGTGNDAADSIEEVVACADDCQKACCLGCKATEGKAACLADHSCCAAHKSEDAEEADTHEGHDHEEHDHE